MLNQFKDFRINLIQKEGLGDTAEGSNGYEASLRYWINLPPHARYNLEYFCTTYQVTCTFSKAPLLLEH